MNTVLRILFFSIFFTFSCSATNKHTISGHLPDNAGQLIKLEGFSGLKSYTISQTTVDKNGDFQLSYAPKDYGVGFLTTEGKNPLIVILSGEGIHLKGRSLADKGSLKVIEGKENQWFEQYALEHPKREQALSAWQYLERLYEEDPLFAAQQVPIEAIQMEKSRIVAEDSAFVANLPEDSYVRWFLPVRKLVSSVSVVAQYRAEEIPTSIAAFRNLDYTDPRLYKSGLFKDAIESHFWLLENSGRSLDSVFIEMQLSIDAMLENLASSEEKLNEVADYLFDLLERHSLFQASEYLAIKVLNEVSCTINSDLAKQLETYRTMKKGNIAPDISFSDGVGLVFMSKNQKVKKLSEFKSEYTVVVFGASWCPKCTEEIPQMAQLYEKWKANGVEVLFVSLDQDEKSFRDFSQNLPFTSICDFKKWEGKVVNDYYVFATPTMYLLDKNLKIVLRPNSLKQMDAWVDWFLVEGNN
ncbi:MAG: TlpA family protein disulfide reductase [Cryomorphaceae bacterium]|nr:TlpA family protein disulfide reductase [Cryomorphaceae bacterium]